MPSNEDSWNRYQESVLKQLQSLSEQLTALQKNNIEIQIQIARLEVKSGLWGFGAGLLPAIFYLIYEAIKR